jgi:hypothetical protein
VVARRRQSAAIVIGLIAMAGTALWLFTGASSAVSKAQSACHRQVTTTHHLANDTQFIDSQKRATGDVIVVQGEARNGGRLAVNYTCTVRGAAGGGFTVQLSSTDHR